MPSAPPIAASAASAASISSETLDTTSDTVEDCSAEMFVNEVEDDGYRKTIRWHSSVDKEQTRRAIYRQQYPTKKGGIARRVRSKSINDTYVDEEGEDCVSSVSSIPEGEDMEKMVAEYRKLVTASLSNFNIDSDEDEVEEEEEEKTDAEA